MEQTHTIGMKVSLLKMIYSANYCKKCKRFFASQAKKPKCPYCNSTCSEKKLSDERSKIISEFIRRKNAEYLYEV